MESRKRTIAGIAVLAFSACLIGAGIMRGELLVVFTKAVRICLECIGLG